MSKICYPYGEGITCVCDLMGRIYSNKCFPELESESKQFQHPPSMDNSIFKGSSGKSTNFLDGSTEIVLASTFLLLVILVFFGFVLYRCEKTLLKKRNQQQYYYGGHKPSLSYISVSIQTDPLVYEVTSSNAMTHSHTIPRISNGSAKTGITSLYSFSRPVTRNGSISGGYLLPPPPPPNNMKLEEEQLMSRSQEMMLDQQGMVVCHSPENENDMDESENGAHSEIGLCEKY